MRPGGPPRSFRPGGRDSRPGGADRGGFRRRPPLGPAQVDYRGFVEWIAMSIAEEPDQVKVDAVERSGGVIAVKVKMSVSDMGRLIGKSGRNIEALRTLVKVAGSREGRRVFIDLL